MEFLTKRRMRMHNVILNDDFIDRNWEHIEKLATSAETINSLNLRSRMGMNMTYRRGVAITSTHSSIASGKK